MLYLASALVTHETEMKWTQTQVTPRIESHPGGMQNKAVRMPSSLRDFTGTKMLINISNIVIRDIHGYLCHQHPC